MAAIFLARRSAAAAAAAATNIPRAPATTSFSTAFQRDEGRNSASGGDEEGPAAFMADTVKQGVQKATKIADAMVDGAKNTVERGWGAAKDANQGVRETVVTGGRGEGGGGGTEGEVDEEGETVVEQVVEEIKDIDGPVDMAEYRAMAQNMEEDLNNKVD